MRGTAARACPVDRRVRGLVTEAEAEAELLRDLSQARRLDWIGRDSSYGTQELLQVLPQALFPSGRLESGHCHSGRELEPEKSSGATEVGVVAEAAAPGSWKSCVVRNSGNSGKRQASSTL
ncbi:hypothetical protein NDU88_006913 [Pleurodeles waltl]|uniref:Uncharacterized protein n=1 Tax=Pleurodeles waltl TaxID=8319 RepID=A0AAV7QQA1_PLEWA|nr:hypothetical protein NDU88_006913 [Pleurodeles waltl]